MTTRITVPAVPVAVNEFPDFWQRTADSTIQDATVVPKVKCPSCGTYATVKVPPILLASLPIIKEQ